MVKWISVKIVVDGTDEHRCDLACPHFRDVIVTDADRVECDLYHRPVPARRRCDECYGAKEL